jgi:peptidoglycan/LPS O-acetylase OafA/YrhL
MLGYQAVALDTILLTCGVALGAAFLSYRTVELPALRLKARLGSVKRTAAIRNPAPE